MKVKTKWKKYALGYHLSNWDGKAPVKLYTALANAGTDKKIYDVLEAQDIEPFYRFENDSFINLAIDIQFMAEELQTLDDQP